MVFSTADPELTESTDSAVATLERPARSGPKPAIEGTKARGEQAALYLFVIIPFVAFLAAVPLAWGWGLGWTSIGLAIGFYIVSGLGITVGYHRYFTHGSFKANRGLKIALAIAGSLAIEGPVIRWVADHRRHHAFSDKEGDPHSPWRYGESVPALLKGLGYAHVGWLFDVEQTNQERFTPDLLADPDLVWIDRYFPAWVAVSLLLAGPARRIDHDVVDGRPDRLLLGLAGARGAAAPRDLVDQLDLPRDRQAAVRRPRQERELLAAGDPELRRELAQHAPRRPDGRSARGTARSARLVGPVDPLVPGLRLGAGTCAGPRRNAWPNCGPSPCSGWPSTNRGSPGTPAPRSGWRRSPVPRCT